MNSDIKQFFIFSIILPVLLFTTIISPINVFGFSDSTERLVHVKEVKKDPTSFEIIVTDIQVDSQTNTDKINHDEPDSDLGLRWEPHNKFIGDDN